MTSLRTGVFWRLADFILRAWNVNLGNYYKWSVTRRFRVTREGLENIHRYSSFYHSILRNFETRLLRMVRVVYRDDFDMRFAIWSFDAAFHDFSFFKHFLALAYFCDSVKRIFHICDPWSSIFFSVREPCNRPPVWWLTLLRQIL